MTKLSVGPSSIISGSTQNRALGTVTIQRAPGETWGMYISVTCTGAVCAGLSVGQPWVPAGADSGTFDVSASGIASAPQTAILSSGGVSAELVVNPFAITLGLSGDRVVGGSAQNSVTGTLVLDAAVQGTRYATLACAGTACPVLSMPQSVAVTGGTNTATFTVSAAGPVSSALDATITATVGRSDGRTLSVHPFRLQLKVDSVLLSGQRGTAAATVDVATRGNLTVSLAVTPSTALTGVPPSVTISAGQTSTPFTVTAATVLDYQAASVTGTIIGSTDVRNVEIVPLVDTDCLCGRPANVGHPINVMNGNAWIRQTDYEIPGLGGGLMLQRTWSSLWPLANPIELAGPFGHSWRSTFDERLQRLSTTFMKYWQSDGSVWSYRLVGSSWVQVTPPDEYSALTVDGTLGRFVVSLSDGTVKQFDPPELGKPFGGYLREVLDRNGRQTTIQYAGARPTQVTDPAGRVLRFNYATDTSAQVASIEDAVGVVATYTYSGSQLKQVTYADGSSLSYLYNPDMLITSVSDGAGTTIEAHTFDANRRGLTSQRASGAEAVSVTYPPVGGASVTITDSKSRASTLTYTLIGGRKFVTQFTGGGCATCALNAAVAFEYDERGNAVRETNARGQSIRRTFDGFGRVLTSATTLDDGTEAAWAYTYGAYGLVLTVTDPLTRTTTNVYDDRGNLLSSTTPPPNETTPGSVTTLAYDLQGQLVDIGDPLGRHVILSYTPAGLIETITNAAGQVTTFEYDARGNRIASVDAERHRTAYS